MDFFESYTAEVNERAKLGVPPLPLDAKKTSSSCRIVKKTRG